MMAVKIPDAKTPQSPVCPRIVDKLIDKKNPLRLR